MPKVTELLLIVRVTTPSGMVFAMVWRYGTTDYLVYE